ncbi:MAG: lysophospholipid acyltransferase family protein [Candidatus Omnitrophota bacterium]
MDFKKIRKSTSRFFSWLGLAMGSLIIRCLPASFVYRFARGMGFLAYCFASKHRKLAIESLNIAFGKEKTKVQIEQIAKDCFIFMAKSGVELVFFMNKPFKVKGRVKLEGRENLDRALAKGCGVILVSAHFGNFPLLLARLAMEGYKAGGIMKPMHDARMEKIFLETRDKFGVKTIYSQPRKACVDNTIQALRNNELIFIPIDQNFGTGGIFVNFFGKKAATAAGPIVLTRRTGAALLPCFIIRQPGDTHKIIFEPALELEEGKDAQDTVLINIQKLTDIIEKYIRKYPAEWGWIHRRWKSRPS